MNDLVKSHNSHKSILAMIASLLACFALVLALVPVQSFAVDDESGETPGTEQGSGTEGDGNGDGQEPGTTPGDEQEPGTNPGDEQKPGDGQEPGTNPGDEQDPGTTTPGDDEGDDAKEIAIPTAAQNLTYTGAAQELVKLNEGYEVEAQLEDGQEVEETKTAIMATNAGTYTLTVTPAEGYAWTGGGSKAQTLEVSIAQADLSKATTITVANVTFLGEPVEPKVTITAANDVVLEADVDYTLEYDQNDAVGTGFVVATGIGNYKGIKVATFEIVGYKAMYRVYNPNNGEHFYTADENERNELVALGWQNENIGWYAPSTSNVPVFRLYNPNAGEHLFTLDSAERDALIKEGWNDEGIGWYSDENETVKVLRQYNPNAFANNHNYTTSEYEYEHNNDLGWHPEGVAWYAAADGDYKPGTAPAGDDASNDDQSSAGDDANKDDQSNGDEATE